MGADREQCGKPDALLHRSDQGRQYTREQFPRLITDGGVTCSMSGSSNCWNNAKMESFFSSLKTGPVGRKVYRPRDEVRADVFDYIEYIERFYNPTRRPRRSVTRAPSTSNAKPT